MNTNHHSMCGRLRPATLAVAMAALSTMLTGCGRESGAPGWGVHSAEIGLSAPHVIDGIHDFAARFGTWGQDRWALAAWTNGGWDSFEASWDSERRAVHYRGHATDGDRRILVECYTADGISGTLRVGAQNLRLEHGSFLVVRFAPEGEIEVRQLERAPEDVPMDSDALARMAETDSDLLDLFAPKAASN